MHTDHHPSIPEKVRKLALEKQLGSFLLKNVNQFQNGYVEYLFEEGMIQVRTIFFMQFIQPLFYWRDVTRLRTTAKTDLDFRSDIVDSQFVRHLRLESADGRIWKTNLRGETFRSWARDYLRKGMQERDHEPGHELKVAVQIEEKIAQAQIGRVREDLAAGGTVKFGRISATLEGISWDEHAISWEQFANLGRQTYRGRGNLVWIFLTDGNNYTLPAAEVDNRPTLGLLWEMMHPEVPDSRQT